MSTQSTGQWTLASQDGLDALQYDPTGTKSAEDLGPDDVLVELHAASLNYRDLAVTQVRAFVFIVLTHCSLYVCTC